MTSPGQPMALAGAASGRGGPTGWPTHNGSGATRTTPKSRPIVSADRVSCAAGELPRGAAR